MSSDRIENVCGALVGSYGAGWCCALRKGHDGDHSPVSETCDCGYENKLNGQCSCGYVHEQPSTPDPRLRGVMSDQMTRPVTPVPAASSAVEQATIDWLFTCENIAQATPREWGALDQRYYDAGLRLIAALRAESADHSQCHDLVCNGDRSKPRGTKGVSCSCKSWRERAESYAPCPACAEKDQQIADMRAAVATKDKAHEAAIEREWAYKDRAERAEAESTRLQANAADQIRRAYRDRNRHMSEIEQAIHLLQTKVAEIRRDAAKPHPVEDAHFIATSVAEADAIDTVIAALPPHEWRYDERAQVYRCWKCLVRSDRPHARTCAVTLTVTCD